MPDFNVGDRVRSQDNKAWDPPYRNRVGTITSTPNSRVTSYRVLLDATGERPELSAPYDPGEFDLIGSAWARPDLSPELLEEILTELPEDSLIRTRLYEALHPVHTMYFVVKVTNQDPKSLLTEALDYVNSDLEIVSESDTPYE